jgi:hypothetical protein
MNASTSAQVQCSTKIDCERSKAFMSNQPSLYFFEFVFS